MRITSFQCAMHMKVIVQQKRLWEPVNKKTIFKAASETRSDGRGAALSPAAIIDDEQESQNRDLALAFLLNSIDLTCK